METAHIDCHILIGKYSSIAHDVTFVMGMNHHLHSVTTYGFDELKLMESPDYYEHKDGAQNHCFSSNHYQIIIGNDVWIGCHVLILSGVRIGNGAIIGAGAVVAKDVPPYSVVVGNPARVVKYRFSEEIINKLQEMKWWNWPQDKINEAMPFFQNPIDFINKFHTPPRGTKKTKSYNRSKICERQETKYFCS